MTKVSLRGCRLVPAIDLREPHLSKSRYVTGLQCEKRLWLGWHRPEPRGPDIPGSIFAMGTEIGEAARLLYPEGVLVSEGPREFGAAHERTIALLSDPTVSTIFEAAFEYQNVVVRPDIICRLADGRWALQEVKSTTRAKQKHVDDLAVQAFSCAEQA